MGVIRPNSFSGSAACATPTPTSLRSVDPPHKDDYPALDWRAFAVEALFEGHPRAEGGRLKWIFRRELAWEAARCSP
jgi:hypothetical protein